jgi:pimeloyl-ACP methyl ester carboxylesterase
MIDNRVLGTSSRGAADVDDLVFRGRDGVDVEAYLVRPASVGGGPDQTARSRGSPSPGVLMWHWLDSEAPDGNRTQYLDEAADLASAGVVSLLPQGRFPWQVAPDNAEADATEIRAEVARLRAGLDLLSSRPDVDATRLAAVGHDFGGMLAAVAAAEESRLRAVVIIAATPRWGDWFLRFWQIADDRIDYLRALRPLDPIERIGGTGPAAVLCQFAERDFYIAPMTALELHRAAPDGSELRWYDTGHDMRLPEIRADRRVFLERNLDVATPAGSAEPIDDGAPGTGADQAATT